MADESNQVSKSIFKSKTVIFNLLGAGLEVIQLLADSHIVSPDNMVLFMGVGNIALRLITGKPISFKSNQKS